jgi:hypothetical protein
MEIRALDLDTADVPTDSVRHDEVVGELVVERVERGLEVLGAGNARRRVVVLVVEDVARSRGCRGAERERTDRCCEKPSPCRRCHSFPLTYRDGKRAPA